MKNILIELESRDLLSRQCERALLVGFWKKSCSNRQVALSHLNELEELVNTIGIPVLDKILVHLEKSHPRFLIGQGKVEEIASMLSELKIDLVVFDDDITASQQRNLERYWGQAVIDRREVILDIFADRATTREAVLQVALARFQYSLPRLTRAWTHLSRQRGGAKGNRGKGETQLETDRRLVLDKIARMKNELNKLKQQRDLRRKRRFERPIPSVALVGYTNAGKSSLLNAMSGSDVLVEDKLFATLDPTTRKMTLEGGREVLLTDTVGFIRKLPPELVDAFHSTLEEAIDNDIILHVADAGNDELDEHIQVTKEVLDELGDRNKPYILVLNKCDRLNAQKATELATLYPNALFVSALKGIGLDDLASRIAGSMNEHGQATSICLPVDRWDLYAQLHRQTTVISENFCENEINLEVWLSAVDFQRFSQYVIDPLP